MGKVSIGCSDKMTEGRLVGWEPFGGVVRVGALGEGAVGNC